MPRKAAVPRSARPRKGPALTSLVRLAAGAAASTEAAPAAARNARRSSPLPPDIAAVRLEVAQIAFARQDHVAGHAMLERGEGQPGFGARARARAGQLPVQHARGESIAG